MLKIIVLAALLLITGCTANDSMRQKQVTPEQTRIETHALTTTPAPTVTQASSIAAPGVGQSSITINQASNAAPNLLDLLNPESGPNGNPAQQVPAKEKTDQTTQTSQFEQQVLD
jgi:hypothetical protein